MWKQVVTEANEVSSPWSWRYRQLWTVWHDAGNPMRALRRAVHVLNCWAISQAPGLGGLQPLPLLSHFPVAKWADLLCPHPLWCFDSQWVSSVMDWSLLNWTQISISIMDLKNLCACECSCPPCPEEGAITRGCELPSWVVAENWTWVPCNSKCSYLWAMREDEDILITSHSSHLLILRFENYGSILTQAFTGKIFVKIIWKNFLTSACLCVSMMCVWACVVFLWRWKKASDPLEMELQAVVSHVTQVPGRPATTETSLQALLTRYE